MGGSHSQSYDLSHETMKSIRGKQDIVPSNNIIDGTLIHITSSDNSNVLPCPQELQRTYPLEEIPLTPAEIPEQKTKTSSSKIIETAVE